MLLILCVYLLGMEKINFSGGEPFLHDKGEFLGKLVQYCKQDLQLPSVSIVSNGSMIKEKWFQKYGKIPNQCKLWQTLLLNFFICILT